MLSLTPHSSLFTPHFDCILMQEHRLFLFYQTAWTGLFSAKVGKGIPTLITPFDSECRQCSLAGLELFDFKPWL